MTRLFRFAAAGVAWLFAGCVVVQVFLVGLSLFDSDAHWAQHRAFGTGIGAVAVALVLVALAARLPLWLFGLAALVLVLVLYSLRFVLVHHGPGFVRAWHPVNAVAILALSILVGRRTLAVAMEPRLPPPSVIAAGLPPTGATWG